MVIPEEIQDLIIDQLAGEITSEEQGQLKIWLENSDKNQVLYTQFCVDWYSGVVGGKRKENDRIWYQIASAHSRRVRRRIILRVVAIAACCTLFLGGYFIFQQEQQIEQPRELTVADLIQNREVEQVKLVLSSGREVPLQGAVVEQEAGISIQSDSVGIKYLPTNDADKKEVVYNELIVPKCGEYRLVLADGTRIMINSESSLRFPVAFSGTTREVWLDGEAYFDVTRDKKKPFIVHMVHADVRVLGTSFNAMAYKDEKSTEITLVEGAVEVGAAGHCEKLIPGNQVRVNHLTARMENCKVDVNQYIAWKEGILRFDDMSLGQLIGRLSRWYDIAFVFQNEELKERLFSGGFKKYEKIERVLEMIQEISDVKFSVVNNKVIISKK